MFPYVKFLVTFFYLTKQKLSRYRHAGAEGKGGIASTHS
jgi:hypothetical protein